MDSIPQFVKNKHNPEGITYVSPLLEPVLNVTYGCIVYQEQVMKIVQVLAGYTLGRADSVRKFMGKKKLDDLKKERQVFLYGCPADGKKPAVDGCVKRGLDEAVANKLWDEMEKFGSYAFNKSHAAAYAHVSYQTAYLKCHYEPEFLTAVLNNRITITDEVINYVSHARERGIEVLPPDINKSDTFFTIKDGKIRFGFCAIRGLGESICNQIVEERNKNGDFKDLSDFLSRTVEFGVNKRVLEGMIFSGAFDCFGKTRSQLAAVYENALNCAVKDKRNRAGGQFSMFGDLFSKEESLHIDYPAIQEYDLKTKLKKEKEALGVYISAHPLDEYSELMKTFDFNSSMLKEAESADSEVEDFESAGESTLIDLDGQNVVFGGILADVQKRVSKATGMPMAVVKVEDLYGTVDVMIFNKMYEQIKNELQPDSMTVVKGRVSIREGQNPIIIAEKIDFIDENNKQMVQEQPKKLVFGNAEAEVKKKPKLYLRFYINNESMKQKVFDILEVYSGETEVFVQHERKLYNLGFNVETSPALMAELGSLIGNINIKVL